MKTEFNVERVCERLMTVIVESDTEPTFQLKHGVLTIVTTKVETVPAAKLDITFEAAAHPPGATLADAVFGAPDPVVLAAQPKYVYKEDEYQNKWLESEGSKVDLASGTELYAAEAGLVKSNSPAKKKRK